MAALSQGFEAVLGRPVLASEEQAFSRYLSSLLTWNRIHRLTSYREPREIASRLFVDSLLFLRWVPPGGNELLDLGAGAGIPGIPLRIVEPRIRLTLLEARRKRHSFLSNVVRELGLTDVRVLLGRAEALLETEPRLIGAFDLVVLRAAGPLEAMIPVSLRFLKSGGRLIASGPPAGKPLPSLPAEVTHRWETVKCKGLPWPRRFVIVEKAR